MTASWLLISTIATIAVVWLSVRGVQAMAPGGSGAVWCWLAAVGIVAGVTWTYRHREVQP